MVIRLCFADLEGCVMMGRRTIPSTASLPEAGVWPFPRFDCTGGIGGGGGGKEHSLKKSTRTKGDWWTLPLREGGWIGDRRGRVGVKISKCIYTGMARSGREMTWQASLGCIFSSVSIVDQFQTHTHTRFMRVRMSTYCFAFLSYWFKATLT